MKIGLVRRGYSASGGAEKYLLRLAAELQHAGHEILLFSDRAWADDVLGAEGVPIVQVRVPGADPLSFATQFRSLLPQHPDTVVLSLERVFACDIYRAGDGVHAAWLDRRARFEPPWKRAFRWLNPKHQGLLDLERALFTGGARRVIANSQMVKREIAARHGYPENRIDVVYNGIPQQAEGPSARSEARAELGLNAQDYVALFVGSGWERKGLRFAWDASWQVPGLRLLIAGKGKINFNPHLAPHSGDHPYDEIPQRFLGPRSDIPRLLAAADVFILPTIYDPFSNACLEALSAGLPVITTASNGFAEVIQPGVHGTVIDDPADLPTLVAALREWQECDRREATRAARLTKAGEFSMQRNVQETLSVIDRLGSVA